MRPEFFMAKAELLVYQVGCGQRFDGIEVRLRDVPEDEGAERAVICFPDIVGLGVSVCIWAGESTS